MLALAEALLRAGDFLKEYEAKGYFLCSVFSSMHDNDISEWILHLCSDKTNEEQSSSCKSLDCYVRSDSLSVEESQAMAEHARLDVKRVKVPVEKAVETAGLAAATTLITLHGSPPVWTLNFITPALMVTTVEINAETGKIMRKETTSILKKD